jgi:ubiquitin-protein ligase E3 A
MFYYMHTAGLMGQRNGDDSERLPTALTCFSRLLVPEYSTRERLQSRLVCALENAHGFGLV